MLADTAASIGLDREEALAVLAEQRFAEEEQAPWMNRPQPA